MLGGCYTPMNNSGVATTKPWIEIPGKRVDFEGKQYDSCVRFNLRFWPQEAAQRLDLQETCITACCWRSEKNQIVLDFNKNFEAELHQYGRARKYTPGQITLKVTHSNLVNVTRAAVSPRGAITTQGLVKLSYKEVEDKKRLAQLAYEREQAAQQVYQPAFTEPSVSAPISPMSESRSASVPASKQTSSPTGETLAKAILQQQAGSKIDTYFYQMNKTYQQQQAIFILSSRLLIPRLQPDGTYLVTCHAKARTGIDQKHLNSSDFPCGVWLVDVYSAKVFAHDNKAKQIAAN